MKKLETINSCEKHGRVMLHNGLCHDCRNENLKTGTPNSDINYFSKKVLKLSASDIINLVKDDMEMEKTSLEHFEAGCQCLACTIRKVLAWAYTLPENSHKVNDWGYVNSATDLLVQELQPKSLRCKASDCKCYVHDQIPAKGEIKAN